MGFDGITLVTGAAGFIGKHLVARLANCGARVRAAVRAGEDASFARRAGAEVRYADLTVAESLPPLFDGGVDRVFHLAAICNFSTPYSALHPTNVIGVERITDLALHAGVKSYVHLGSTSVYGPYRGRPFVEGAPQEPQDDYGRSKRDGEAIVWDRIEKGLPAVIARPCTVYGSGCTDGAGKVFSRPTSIAVIPGSGRQRLSNVRVEDVAAAAVHLSEDRDSVGQAFNLADDSHPQLGEALALAAEVFGRAAPRLHLPVGLLLSLARLQGLIGRSRGRIPDLEIDALRFLRDDYIVDNTKLKAAGYRLLYPDFHASLHELGQAAKRDRAETSERYRACRSW